MIYASFDFLMFILFKNKADNILQLAFLSFKSHSISNLLNFSPEEKIKV